MANLTGYAVEFEELPESPQEVWGTDSFKATMTLLCDWDKRGGCVLQFGNHYYPRLPESKALPVNITVQPFTGQKTGEAPGHPGFGNYKKALITIQYDNSINSQEGGGGSDTPAELVTEALEPAAEFLTLKGTKIFFDKNGKYPVGDASAPGHLVFSLVYKVSLYGCRYIPSGCFDLLNSINAGPTPSYTLGITFAPGTLMYSNFSCERRITTQGTEGWTLNFSFHWRPANWNLVWDTVWADFKKVYLDNGQEYRQYASANFGVLI